MIVVWIILFAIVALVVGEMLKGSTDNSACNTAQYSTNSINTDIYTTMLMLSKVGLAFLSGSDGGFLSFVNNANSVIYILNCKSSFFIYRDDFDISEDTLLEQQGGGCPLSEWNRFMKCVNVRSISRRTGAEELEFRSVLSLSRKNTNAYLQKLQADLASTYPEVSIELDNKGLSIIMTGSNRKNCRYR